MSKKKKYIIVESPAKAKTIKGILGPEYEVFASMGHIVDLPKSKFGVDLKNDFEPQFTVIKGKEKIVEKIKAISKVGEIFIASDMDREGEAIAWHVARLTNTLGKRNRIIFSEITPRVIKEAVKNPRKIDMNKVHAQLARRILDRIVGYSLSPVLWKNFKSNLSAGRVQSATLKLVCDREREILRFVPKKYHRVVVKFHGLEAEMITKEKTFLEEDVLKELQSIEELVVEEKTVSRKKFSPPDPFKTSSLQQEAYAKLGFSVAKTMLLAQQLYEGVETKEGHIAFITYMRTDSTRVSDYAKEAARELIEKDFGKEYIGTGRRKKSRTARIQDAHEAIRPTDVFMTPEKISKYLNPDQRKLYELIWKRFFASQMKPSEYEETRFVLRSKDGKYRFKGSILKRIFDGYERVWKTERNVGDFPFEEGEIVKPVEVEIKELETKPKPRYTEGTLVKEMERLGIGRPSTYASTIKLLLSRKYVKKIRGYLYPTVIGSVVMDYLEKKYADIVDISFTAEMEKELDEVEQGKKTDKVVLQDFYRTFSKVFNENDRIIINYPTDQKCSCGKDMVLSFGRYGFYLKCECGKSRSVRNDEVAVIENGKMFIGRKNDEDSTSDGGNVKRKRSLTEKRRKGKKSS
ncbi:type I DNA topoisomerase [Thermotoga neapolitana]|uniref:DNA topoisomerase 1 n=1 Tax=Thermotoga neapolitana (strain ATCC 49049 / DSM 4359 / NBRC 107923 / NS-E) TaxID=309803 RepID=B9KC58_THENN|nr:type I DNA topoisomerase [Thermotoga neapolitana]MDK2785491.1 topoisomerase [Thermotoga sp.]ACM22604.1 DNA topoisomerase 1 [Thermotoga neapolitana DSM 4359]KFZ22244.1 DNA topoisomerase I [Thermotoga neapolitana LA10]MDK2949830.1 topoisomerase [Thermotoga sp.]HBF11035.1 type I DNA topoisomerase [Thermotoga neapolitana]